MGFIPEEIIAQVIERCDIVEAISSYIPLKRTGRNFKANCPFHHEKTPSFSVNPEKQIFYCFGCHVGGNVITFVMQQERIDFPEAVRMLAGKAGIVIPQSGSSDNETLSFKDVLYDVNGLAAQFFHNTLVAAGSDTAEAVKYLKNRGINLETVKRFQLGFAPDKWDSLIGYLRGKNINLAMMEKAGLIISKENRDGYYDRFRDRIIFPIFDVKSRCIGFGARAMKEGIAKYINSPETAVYTKGNHLYGFHIAKDGIREKDFAIVVEGYMDFIIPFQAGVANVVASLGTALTVEQIRLLHRYSKNIVMLFDADSAGENAMVRSLDLLVEEGMNVKVAILASGEDPDSFVRKFGVDPFNERINQALPLFDYKMKILMSRYSHKTVDGKTKIAGEMLPTLSKFTNAVTRFGYVKQLADMLSVAQEALLIELQKISSGTLSAASRKIELDQTAVFPAPAVAAERSLLKLLLEDESFIPLMTEEIAVSDFRDEAIRSVVSQMFDFVSQGKEVKASGIMNSINDQKILQMISQLLVSEEHTATDRKKVYRDCVHRIKDHRLKFIRRDLSQQIRLAEVSGDETKLEELKQKFNQLIKG